MWVIYSSLETYISFRAQPNIYVYIYSLYGKMGSKEILYFFLNGNNSNDAFVLDTVNILGVININNNIFKN